MEQITAIYSIKHVLRAMQVSRISIEMVEKRAKE